MNIGDFLNQNYIKQEVGLQEIYQPTMADIPEQTKKVSKKKNVYKFSNWKKVFNRLLMSGYHKKDIISNYKTNIKVAGIDNAEQYLTQKDGLIGTIFVDCSSLDQRQFPYERCSNKLKKYHRFAINCTCNKFETIKTRKSSNDGTFDGYLEDKNDKLVISKKQYCAKCGLPVINTLSQIKSSQLKQVVDDLVQNHQIGLKQAQKLKSGKNLLSNLRNIFANNVGVLKIKKSQTNIDNSDLQFKLKNQKLQANSIKSNEVIQIVQVKNPLFNKNDVFVKDDKMKTLQVQSLKQQRDFNKDLELNNENDLQIFVKPVVLKEQLQIDNNDIVNIQPIIQQREYKDDFELNGFDQILVQVKPKTFDYEMQINQANEEIQFDNEQYIDKQWFEKDQMEVNDISQTQQPLKISNKFSFDF